MPRIWVMRWAVLWSLASGNVYVEWFETEKEARAEMKRKKMAPPEARLTQMYIEE